MKTLQVSFIGAKCQATTPELIALIRLHSKICSTRTAEPLILTESRRMGSFLSKSMAYIGFTIYKREPGAQDRLEDYVRNR